MATSGSIGYQPEQAQTLKAGSNKASTGCVICGINSQGPVSGDIMPTLSRGGDGGTHLSVAIAVNQRGEVRLDGTDGQTIGAIPATRSGKQFQGVLTPWDVQSKRVNDPGGTCPTMPSVSAQGGIQPVVATGCISMYLDATPKFSNDLAHSLRRGGDGGTNAETCVDMAPTLSARSHKDAPITVVTRCGCDGGGKGALTSEDVSLTLSTRNEQSLFDPHGGPRYVVRRLTPVECERLQGFPDNWTQVPYRGKPATECPDGPRYKAIGNSMAVPVMKWIGKRIQEVDDACD